jgi:hypothetical protein
VPHGVSYTIEMEVLERFNAAVPAGERSQVIQRLMETALADLERPFEDIAARAPFPHIRRLVN